MKNEYLAALAKENSLAGALNAQKGDALAMNRKAIDYSVLEREVQSGRQLYDSLLQRAKETGVSTELKTSNIRIVDRAERPLRPGEPAERPQPAARAVRRHRWPRAGWRSSSSISTAGSRRPTRSGLTSACRTSACCRRSTARRWPQAIRWSARACPANFAEAFRAIRTNVLFSSAQEGSRSIVVTSTGPGEGKSMVASNLAISLAQAGQRTLLIDADMRKPQGARDLRAARRSRACRTCWSATRRRAKRSARSGVAGLWVMPSGRMPPNPAELLGSQRFRDFLALARRSTSTG